MRTMPAEVTPENLPERTYVLLFMFLAFSLFAITVAQITQTSAKFFEKARAFKEDMLAVRTYLKTIDAPESLKDDIVLYLRHLFDRRKIMAKESSMTAHLPENLKTKLRSIQVAGHLRNHNLFQHISDKSMVALCGTGKVNNLVRGSLLSRRGALAEQLSVVVDGVAQLMSVRAMVRSSGEGAVEVEDFSGDAKTVEVIDEECLERPDPVRSRHTAVAVTCCEVVQFEKKVFFEFLRKNPELGIISPKDTFRATSEPASARPLLGNY